MCRNEAKIPEKSVRELNKKRCLKTEPNTSKKTQKMNPKWVPTSDTILQFCFLGRLWWTKHLLWSKSRPPALPKCAQRWTNEPKMTPERPRLWKRAPKLKPFRSLARRTARSACNIRFDGWGTLDWYDTQQKWWFCVMKMIIFKNARSNLVEKGSKHDPRIYHLQIKSTENKSLS